MIELLEQVNYWHWLAFGLTLLAVELLGTAGYFLWLGLSALLVGVIMSVLPIGWQMQWTSFAALSLLTTWLWWRYQHQKDRHDDAERKLNQRGKQLIGQSTRLDQDIQAGNCRITLGDTTWSAKSDVDISAGTLIEVIAVDGIVVTIAPKS